MSPKGVILIRYLSIIVFLYQLIDISIGIPDQIVSSIRLVIPVHVDIFSLLGTIVVLITSYLYFVSNRLIKSIYFILVILSYILLIKLIYSNDILFNYLDSLSLI